MKTQQMISPSRQCSSTLVGLSQGFLNKNYVTTMDNPPINSYSGTSWFLPVPSTEIGIDETAL